MTSSSSYIGDPACNMNNNSTLPSTENSLSSQIANILNVSPRKLAQHEDMVAELQSHEAENSPIAHSNGVTLATPAMIPGSPIIRNTRGTKTSPLTPPVTPTCQAKKLMKKSITSLVFFDLETTGLAHEIGKHNVQITELSMIAMNREEFENSMHNDLRDIRIMHKLSLCFRPRTNIAPAAAKITGLDNKKLRNEQTFDENAAISIICFLTHLPKPVCLLAHNGITFDYPILKSELKRNLAELPADILIADSLRAIRELGVPVFPSNKKVCKSVKFKNGQVSYGLENLHLYFFNKKPTGSHSSEGDCIALAKVCHLMKDSMLPWLDENCSTMDLIKPLW